MPKHLYSGPSKKSKKSIDTIDHRVKLYSLSAAAAGVSVLALTQASVGEVVITKKNIPLNTGGPVSIDLNKDGLADFQFSITSYRTTRSSHLHLRETVKPLTHGGLIGGPWNGLPGPYASALVRGATIGPSAHFVGGNVVIQRNIEYSSGQGGSYGNWPFTYGGSDGTEVRFLGVKFQIKGQTHYGWIRLAVGVGRKAVPGAVLGYAYETIANTRLSAGNTSSSSNHARSDDSQSVEYIRKPGHPSMGMLALGAGGLALWRRDEWLSSEA
jgi:hypothetical protein